MVRPTTFKPGEFWPWHEIHPDELAALHDRLDGSLDTLPLDQMIGALEWPQNSVVADLGGSTGKFLTHLLTERPDLRGILVDRGAVLQIADERLSRFGGRISIVEADLSTDIVPEADVYTLIRTVHNFTDVNAVFTFENLRSSAPKSSVLRVADVFLAEDKAGPELAVQQDEKMQRYFGARQHTLDELVNILLLGGWAPREHTAVSEELSVLEATPIK